jgi:ABC-type glycerol-3-phosphate transport system substrate-binding protein
MNDTRRSRLVEGLRIAASLGALGLFGLLATGCSLKSSSTSSGPALVRVWRIDQDVDPIRGSITAFTQKNGTNVNVTYTRKPLEGYELSSLKSMAARSGPDIWSIPNDWLGDHIARINPLPNTFFDTDTSTTKGAVARVKELYPQGIVDQILSTDGKSVLGAPTSVDTLELYYNPDSFSNAFSRYRQSLGTDYSDDEITPVNKLLSAPPTTWSTLLDQLKYLTQTNGTTVKQSAIALGSANNVPDSDAILQLLMLQNGAKIVSSDRTRALFHVTESAAAGGTVRPGENALSFLTAFSDPSKLAYTWNPSMPSALDAFAQGKVAMVIGFSSFGQNLAIKYPQFRYETAPVPQISVGTNQTPVNVIRFSVDTVPKTADNYNAAVALLKLYSTADVVSDISSNIQLISPFKSQLTNTDNFRQQEVVTGQAVFKKQRTQFDQAFNQMITDVTQNGIPVSQALDNAAETINGLLASADE